MAEKEATFARQEEERTQQRRKAKAEKKAQKKVHKGVFVGEKRKAEQADEWNDDFGKFCTV